MEFAATKKQVELSTRCPTSNIFIRSYANESYYYKEWHVDHRIPLQWFIDNDLMDETNKKIACHYGNLQPLFVSENLSKGDKLPKNAKFIY